MINVLFVQSQTGFGADTAIHADIMQHLDPARFTVHAACATSDASGKAPSLRRIESIPHVRIRPTQFAPGLRGREPREVLAGMRAAAAFPLDFAALCRYIARHRIDIVHGTDRPRDAAYAMALSKVTRAKSVVHVHVKWSNEYGSASQLGVQHCDAAFGISRYVTGTIVAHGKPRERVHTVLNGIDPAPWNPDIDGRPVREELGVPLGAPLLASVSRLFSWKGQRELVKALALVRREIPDVHCLIVGADERFVHGGSFTEELQTLARELGVADRVIFTGKRSDVPRVMAACDVFSMPSFEEPFGLVFLEAMAMKRPVIGVNNGGTPEVVEHGKAGLLSEPWNIEELSRNIVTLLRDPALRATMGEYGRSRVVDYFNAKRMAADAGNAYAAVLGR
jgi:glycosyltransferase involved in cell wall biosynthesis